MAGFLQSRHFFTLPKGVLGLGRKLNGVPARVLQACPKVRKIGADQRRVGGFKGTDVVTDEPRPRPLQDQRQFHFRVKVPLRAGPLETPLLLPRVVHHDVTQVVVPRQQTKRLLGLNLESFREYRHLLPIRARYGWMTETTMPLSDTSPATWSSMLVRDENAAETIVPRLEPAGATKRLAGGWQEAGKRPIIRVIGRPIPASWRSSE